MHKTHIGHAAPAAFFTLIETGVKPKRTSDSDDLSLSYLPVGLRPSFALGLFLPKEQASLHLPRVTRFERHLHGSRCFPHAPASFRRPSQSLAQV